MPRDTEVYVVEEQEYGDLLNAVRLRPPGSADPGVSGTRRVRARAGSERYTNSSPPLAATLSLFVPGAGQIYNGETKLGSALFLTIFLVGMGHWSVLQLWPTLREPLAALGIHRDEILFTAFAVDFLAVFLFLWGIYQAYRRSESDSGPFDGINVPLLPALASLLIPGWGQIGNGQIGKALLFILGLIPGAIGLALLTLPIVSNPAAFVLHPELGLSLRDASIGGIAFSAIAWILSSYDAGLVSRFRQRSR